MAYPCVATFQANENSTTRYVIIKSVSMCTLSVSFPVKVVQVRMVSTGFNINT